MPCHDMNSARRGWTAGQQPGRLESLTQLEQLLQARCWDGHRVAGWVHERLIYWRKPGSKVGESKAVSCAPANPDRKMAMHGRQDGRNC